MAPPNASCGHPRLTDLEHGNRLLPMRRMLGLLLLLIQLGPLAGAGLCLHAATQPAEHCATPMEGMPPHETDRSHHSASPDCALVAVCAPSAPVLPQAAVHI